VGGAAVCVAQPQMAQAAMAVKKMDFIGYSLWKSLKQSK
jgi:hypothetical protein